MNKVVFEQRVDGSVFEDILFRGYEDGSILINVWNLNSPADGIDYIPAMFIALRGYREEVLEALYDYHDWTRRNDPNPVRTIFACKRSTVGA